MPEPTYSHDSSRILKIATKEVRKLGLPYIGYEFLLYALTRDKRTSLLLQSSGITAHTVQIYLDSIINERSSPYPGQIELAKRSLVVLRYAYESAFALAHETIEPEHILLGILRFWQHHDSSLATTFHISIEHLRVQTLRSVNSRSEDPSSSNAKEFMHFLGLVLGRPVSAIL